MSLEFGRLPPSFLEGHSALRTQWPTVYLSTIARYNGKKKKQYIAKAAPNDVVKCENSAKCENAAKCETQSTLKVKIPLNVKNLR